MQRKVKGQFPNLFAALVALDLKDVLTSPWTESARTRTSRRRANSSASRVSNWPPR